MYINQCVFQNAQGENMGYIENYAQWLHSEEVPHVRTVGYNQGNDGNGFNKVFACSQH